MRRYGRFTKGDLCEIEGADERGVAIVKAGRRSHVSYRYADRFTVAKVVPLEISPGDRLQSKANGRTAEGEKMRNGELVTVSRLDGDMLVVADEHGRTKTLAACQRVFVRGYAVTSYSSQGKTTDAVIVADSGVRAATSAQQWYVAISRGRKRIVVLTPSKDRLCMNIQRTADRDLAVDVARPEVKQAMRMAGRTQRSDRSRGTRRTVEQQRHWENETRGIRP